jgi:hypothetical protein
MKKKKLQLIRFPSCYELKLETQGKCSGYPNDPTAMKKEDARDH